MVPNSRPGARWCRIAPWLETATDAVRRSSGEDTMRFLLLLTTLCALAPATARADTTLRYVPELEGGLGLVIEADARGHVRAEGSGGLVLIIRDGVTYMVVGHEDHAVARIEDAAAVATEARARRPSSLVSPRPPARYTVSAHGPQSVGQRAGIAYSLTASPPIPGATFNDIVISTDPALIPLGHSFAQVVGAQTLLFEAALGVGDVDGDRAAMDVLSRGLLLRMVGNYHLESLATDPIPASRFDLPGPLLTRDQLRARQH
jgi:hypothetical protein